MLLHDRWRSLIFLLDCEIICIPFGIQRFLFTILSTQTYWKCFSYNITFNHAKWVLKTQIHSCRHWKPARWSQTKINFVGLLTFEWITIYRSFIYTLTKIAELCWMVLRILTMCFSNYKYNKHISLSWVRSSYIKVSEVISKMSPKKSRTAGRS